MGEAARRPAGAVGAYGEAARLFNEELPGEMAPTEQSKQLEVALLWGDTIINVRHFSVGEAVTIGSGAGNAFQVFHDSLGERFTLVAPSGDRAELNVPASAGLVLRRNGVEKTREQLAGELRPGGAGSVLELGLHDRVQVIIENVALVVRWVRPSRLASGGVKSVDFYFSKMLTTSAMAGAVLLAAIHITDINAESLSEDLFRNPQKFARLMIKAPEKEKKKIEIKKKIEEKVVQTEAQYGKRDTTQKSGPSLSADKREADRKKVMSAGLLGLLGGGDGSTSNVFAPGGLGTGINQALGSLQDSGISDSGGVGGLGSRGTGPGGGGGGLGLGGLGTKGGGKGSLGGYGAIDLSRRGKNEVRVVPGRTTVTGSCERTVIGKTIARHHNEIRYCYEVELAKDPSLAGKVAVTFTIDPTGAVEDAQVTQSTMNNATVEQCIISRIRRWKFPEPKGGGICVINYPWQFRAAGGEEEAE